jgi:transposase
VTIVAQRFDHVIGVDTHSRTHTLVVVDGLGRRVSAGTFPTTATGLRRAQSWIRKNAPGEILVAMEGTGSYGALFAELLESSGTRVSETKPPKRATRRNGKSDDIDAEAAARHALTLPEEKLMVPRRGAGDRAALQVLLVGRRHRTRERTAAVNALFALLRTHDLGVDARTSLSPGTIDAIAHWRIRRTDSPATTTIRGEAASFARIIRALDADLAANLAGLKQHINSLAGWLLDEAGVGPVSAAQLLVSWSHADRIRSEAAFARIAGAAPIPASSGNTTRHRLHRGGDRHLNQALWTIAFSRMNTDTATRDYVARRTAEGLTRKEILRCLKRYIARAMFRKLNATP